METNGFHFPLFVDLMGKKAVVVGGGPIACRRAAVLVRFGADVTMIAPIQTERLDVTWLARPYQPGDLSGASLVVAATDDRAVNQAVGQEAKRKNIPVSVADRRSECTFYFPAICEGEGVVAGVVSCGADHRKTAEAARAVRRALEE